MLVLLLALPSPAAKPNGISQVQVARRFLLAIIHHKWKEAYRYLTPTARQQQSEKQFRQAAQLLAVPAREYGPVLDLYKLGYRLRDAATPEPFVAFTYRADTLQPRPHIQLDVTFRDSTARQIQSFRLVKLAH
ncbi:hypothetical protein CDA63_00225 [Hymenobacter amundsenii]|uniref:DUF3887 domain-containing protein n=1 Tax=Hymenobacter amundsenii TaxID=2006685 RepID=A0A246FPZ9_9BACT|nr:hypothetical protein [Hymenobacter amundsenii]OWP64825.1 hypothetical protein CDA63_00225 [Hymenobacter amundsenii]